MKALRIMLLTIGLGGGALWIGVRQSDARASGGGCAICGSDQLCHSGRADSTCASGRGWCTSSSGCVFV